MAHKIGAGQRHIVNTRHRGTVDPQSHATYKAKRRGSETVDGAPLRSELWAGPRAHDRTMAHRCGAAHSRCHSASFLSTPLHAEPKSRGITNDSSLGSSAAGRPRPRESDSRRQARSTPTQPQPRPPCHHTLAGIHDQTAPMNARHVAFSLRNSARRAMFSLAS